MQRCILNPLKVWLSLSDEDGRPTASSYIKTLFSLQSENLGLSHYFVKRDWRGNILRNIHMNHLHRQHSTLGTFHVGCWGGSYCTELTLHLSGLVDSNKHSKTLRGWWDCKSRRLISTRAVETCCLLSWKYSDVGCPASHSACQNEIETNQEQGVMLWLSSQNSSSHLKCQVWIHS